MGEWPENEMWWQVYPLGSTGAPVRPSGEAERHWRIGSTVWRPGSTM